MLHRMTLAAVAALAAGPVLAGGFAQPVIVPAPAAPVLVAPSPVIVTSDWSGFYVGGQLGYGRLSTDFSAEDEREIFEGELLQGSGPLFGVHAGYMFDFGRLVLGAELDYDKTQIELEPGDDFPGGAVEDIGQVDSVARAKLRVGYDAGRFLPYVTAGLARVTFDFDDEVAAEEEIDEESDGRFIGLGASYMVSDSFMVGIEALRHNFEDTPSFEGAEEAGVDISTMLNTVTLRGSFRF